jgi:hypothetical protein
MNDPPFRVLPFSRDNLFKSLSNARFDPPAVAKHNPAAYLDSYLTDLGAKTIIVESEYTDGDYLDDFSSYYVKCFRDYHRRCKRLHFFDRDFDEPTFRNLILGNVSRTEGQAMKDSYLGFVVARPLPDAIIGRTALKHYDNDGGRRNYPATKEYKANLFGVELSVRSLAFQEQDSVLAACATVALWSAFHKTAELFGTPIPTPVEITKAANQIELPARPIPSHSLTLQQICNSIRHVGLEPEVIQVRPSTPVPSLIYGHLRMGLPVVLLVELEGEGGHALTLAGFSLQGNQVRSSEVASGNTCVPLSGLRIDKFYGHDDQFGPFNRLEVDSSASYRGNTYPIVFRGSWKNSAGTVLRLFPVAVVVPVYHKIRVTFLDALKWLTRLENVLAAVWNVGGVAASNEWDLRLITSNDYKTAVRALGLRETEMSQVLIAQHPRFIWNATLRVNGAEALELLVDATDMARSFPIYRAIWRDAAICGAVHRVMRDPANQDILRELLTSAFFVLLDSAPSP